MRERVELPKLPMCQGCGYAACTCRVQRDHKPDCTRRKAILNTSPTPCDQHGVFACESCWPCECGGKAGRA